MWFGVGLSFSKQNECSIFSSAVFLGSSPRRRQKHSNTLMYLQKERNDSHSDVSPFF